MKIWVIGRDYPETYNNMYGIFEVEQAAMLAKNHKVFYPCVDLHSVKRWRKWGIEKFTRDSVNVYKYNFPLGKTPGNIYGIVKKKLMKIVMNKIEKEQGLPDIIHVHFPAIAYYELFSYYKNRGVKIVCTEHWTRVQLKNISGKFADSLMWFTKNADVFLCVSEHLKESVKDLTRTNREIRVVPNIVSSYYFDVQANRQDNAFLFIAVGRLVPVKQFDMLINAFSKVFHNKTNIKLQIVGEGEEKSNLKHLINSLKMEQQITLMGLKQRKEVAELIKNSNVLVCPSRLETFGVPVIEAMACGKPFIGTEALGFLEYLPDHCGIIVSSHDLDELTFALKNIYENYAEYDSVYITNVAKKYFSEEAVLLSLNRIYKNLIHT